MTALLSEPDVLNSINAHDEVGRAARRLCAARPHVPLLVAQKGNTALLWAAFVGSVEGERACAHCPPQQRGPPLPFALGAARRPAAAARARAAVELLLSKRADPNLGKPVRGRARCW